MDTQNQGWISQPQLLLFSTHQVGEFADAPRWQAYNNERLDAMIVASLFHLKFSEFNDSGVHNK